MASAMAEQWIMGAFDDLEVFVRVVEAGGFARAGAAMNLSRSRVSERVAALETRLGARLFERSTRHVAPTDAGRALYARARRALDEALAGREEVGALVAEPMGTLRVAAPETFADLYVLPALVEFLALHPRLKADLVEGPGQVDLVEGGFDLAIRITGAPDPSLIVRRIATSRVVIVAAPAYLAARGAPGHPRDVAAHDCVGYAPIFWGREWRFRGAEGAVTVPVEPRLLCSSSPQLRAAALEGAGLTTLPFWAVADALADGRLVEVLGDWETPESGVYAVYPSNRMVTPRVRGFVDLLARRLRRRLPERRP
jgi:DNA-binding transcriptional LysR family regulator